MSSPSPIPNSLGEAFQLLDDQLGKDQIDRIRELTEVRFFWMADISLRKWIHVNWFCRLGYNPAEIFTTDGTEGRGLVEDMIVLFRTDRFLHVPQLFSYYILWLYYRHVTFQIPDL